MTNEDITKQGQLALWQAYCDNKMELENVMGELEKVRTMIADFIHAWRWYQEDEYDREAPHDCIHDMIKYMENLGYKINHLGIAKIKDKNM